MFKVGNVKIKNKVIFAPMAGVSNISFRTIIKEMGAGLIYSEMISTMGIKYGSQKTIDLINFNETERPISIQIFGNDVDSFVEAAKYIEDNYHPDIIDINMGCPVPKIALKSQAGSALLKNPDKIYEIVKKVVENTNTPISVKIRSGWDENSINCIEVAKICEKAGASAITLHARTRSQGYSGHSDWSLIKKVKESVNIPVIGNGDVTSCYEAKKMLLETGCDLVMIGRGLLGNPWLIKECNDYLNEGKLPKKVTYEEKIEMMKRHLTGLVNEKGEKSAVLEIRTHFLYYLKGLEGSSEIKNLICKETSYENIIKILDNYLIQLENNK